LSFVGEETIVRRRFSETGDIDPQTGLPPAPTSPTETEGRGTVNPFPKEKADTLPEGTDLQDSRQVITTLDLRATDEQKDHLGDRVVYHGEVYEVREVKRFRRVIPHVEALAVRVNTE
jgi:hypothetical protein